MDALLIRTRRAHLERLRLRERQVADLSSRSADFQKAVDVLGQGSCAQGFGSGHTSSNVSKAHSFISVLDDDIVMDALGQMVIELQVVGEGMTTEQVADLGSDDLDSCKSHDRELVEAVEAASAITNNSLAIAQWMLEKGASESMMTSFIKDLLPQLISGHEVCLEELPPNAKAALRVLEKATSKSAVQGKAMKAWVCQECGWECRAAQQFVDRKQLPKGQMFACTHRPCRGTKFERLTWTMHELADIFKCFVENPRICAHALDHTHEGLKESSLLRSRRCVMYFMLFHCTILMFPPL